MRNCLSRSTQECSDHRRGKITRGSNEMLTWINKDVEITIVLVKEVRTMKVATIALLLIALLATPDFSAKIKSAPANPPAALEPIALVTHINGVVMIKAADTGRAKPIGSTTFLYENDELLVDDSSYALLLQENDLLQH